MRHERFPDLPSQDEIDREDMSASRMLGLVLIGAALGWCAAVLVLAGLLL